MSTRSGADDAGDEPARPPRADVRRAAANNARWCGAVCRAHGLSPRGDPEIWSSENRTPPLYPDAITLVPTCTAAAVLARVDSSLGCSVKDSFSSLDLAPAGFRVLFSATWIVRDQGEEKSGADDELDWCAVGDVAELAEWERACDQSVKGIFVPALLGDPGVRILAGYQGSAIRAGAVLSSDGDLVGLSNLFGPSTTLVQALASSVGYAARAFPGCPIVGYESGARLQAAMACGFRPLGPLRVWIRD